MSDSEDSVRSAYPPYSPGYAPPSPDFRPYSPERVSPGPSGYNSNNVYVPYRRYNHQRDSPWSPNETPHETQQDTKEFGEEEFKVPIVASGGFELHFPDLKTQSSMKRKPINIEKSFGLLKKDNSVLNFRLKVKEAAHGRHLHSFNMELLYLGKAKISSHFT